MRIEQAEDPLGRDHGRLHDRVLGAQVADGEIEAAGVLEKGHEAAEGERPGHHLPAPVPEQQGHRGGAQGLHRRVEGGVVERRPELAGAQGAGELRERLPLPGLAREELDHAHALQRLLQEGVHPGQAGADHPIAIPRAHPEVGRGQHQQGHQRERDEGELPVHPEHDHHHSGEHDHVAQQGHQPAREELLDGLPVVQDPGHQPADGAPVVEARILALQVREQRRAQVVDDPLAGELGEIGLGRPQRVEGEEDQQEQRRDAPEPRPVAAEDVVVDRDLDQVGLDQLQHRHRREKRAGREHEAGVRARERPEAPHQARVVRLAKNLVFLPGLTHSPARRSAAGAQKWPPHSPTLAPQLAVRLAVHPSTD